MTLSSFFLCPATHTWAPAWCGLTLCPPAGLHCPLKQLDLSFNRLHDSSARALAGMMAAVPLLAMELEGNQVHMHKLLSTTSLNTACLGKRQTAWRGILAPAAGMAESACSSGCTCARAPTNQLQSICHLQQFSLLDIDMEGGRILQAQN